ncbi:heme ABC transporter ATP-binding protein [Metabacillus sp. RGM 3146]|uniref:heme ABC transporter ATP-binding protein n=1 Tax=Metabacillus sp. RGM 3146 TaxID=3401092 RepID=UPI003B9AD373
MILLKDVSGGYEKKEVLHNISFQVGEGEFFGILGPNGSGKTTLMKMISGLLNSEKGDILIKGKRSSDYSSKERARVLAVLPQLNHLSFDLSVKEVVSMGRYPHQAGILPRWNEHDEEIVQRVMEETGILPFSGQSIHSLSGGEQQRVFLAQALAQEPDVLLLDEPTNHLDLSYQQELLSALKAAAGRNKLTILSIFHDLNLASFYCDRLLLMNHGQVEAEGSAYEVLEREILERVYGTALERHYHPKSSRPQVLLKAVPEKNFIEFTGKLSAIENMTSFQSNRPLKTLFTGPDKPGFGWYKCFANLPVQKYKDEKGRETILEERGWLKHETILAALPAGEQKMDQHKTHKENFMIQTVVTKASQAISIWTFIHGNLSEGVFLKALMKVTETLTKMNHEFHSDPLILIASTQIGDELRSANELLEEMEKGLSACLPVKGKRIC